MSYIAIGGAAISIVGGLMGSSSAAAAERAAAQKAAALNAQLDSLERNRQAIINPYAATKDLSSMGKNAYANIGVATQAAEFQAEQNDLALASTLDTLRATGASAGGATALAQAALKSQQQVSASLESQEAANEKLRAEGEQKLNEFRISEAQKMQDAANAASQFKYSETEKREIAKMDRVQSQLTGAQNQQASANAAGQMAQANMFSGISSAVTSGLGAINASNAASTAATSIPGLQQTVQSSGLNPAGVTTGGGATFSGALLPGSDRRLKKNINLIGKSDSGLNIYSFEYINSKFGEGLFQGVMSDEVPSSAVIKGHDGYDRVNYSLLDVEFKQI